MALSLLVNIGASSKDSALGHIELGCKDEKENTSEVTNEGALDAHGSQEKKTSDREIRIILKCPDDVYR